MTLKPGRAPAQDVALTIQLNKIPPPRVVRVEVPAPVPGQWVSRFDDGDPFWESVRNFVWSGTTWDDDFGFFGDGDGLAPVTTGVHAGWQLGYRPIQIRISFATTDNLGTGNSNEAMHPRGGTGHDYDYAGNYFPGGCDQWPLENDGATIYTITAYLAPEELGALSFLGTQTGFGGAFMKITNIEFFEP